LLHQVGILAKRGVHVTEQNSLLFEVLAIAMEHHFAFVLCGNACEILALGFRDSELLIRGLHLLGEVVPLTHLFGSGLQVVVDVLKVEIRHVDREPLGHGLLVEGVQRAQTHLAHPLRFTLPPGDLLHNAVIETLLRGKGIFDVVAPTQGIFGKVEVEAGHGEFLLRR